MVEPEVAGLMMPGNEMGHVSLREYIEAILKEQDRALQALAVSHERALKLLTEQQGREVKTLAESTEREVQVLAAGHAREVAELKAHVLEIARLHAEAHAREHDMAQTAVTKAEQAVDRRLATINEAWSQINEQRGLYLPITTYDAKHETLIEKVDAADKALATRITALETQRANMEGRFWALGVGMAIMVVVINVAMKFLG